VISSKGFEDPWLILKKSDTGFTYDTKENKLAEVLSSSGISKRLDRSIFKSKLNLTVSEVSLMKDILCKDNLTPASDHYPLISTFQFSKEDKFEEEKVGYTAMNPKSYSLTSNIDYKSVFKSFSPDESVKLLEKMDSTFNYLKKVFCSFFDSLDPINGNNNNVNHLLFPVGSYGLRCVDDSSDIDCLCIGRLKRSIFEKEIELFLKLSGGNLKFKGATLDALVPVWKFSINNVQIDLIYSNLPSEKMTKWFNPKAIANSDLRKISDACSLSFSAITDLYAIKSVIDNHEQMFVETLRLIKSWAKCKK
jgi:hypothetical protein